MGVPYCNTHAASQQICVLHIFCTCSTGTCSTDDVEPAVCVNEMYCASACIVPSLIVLLLGSGETHYFYSTVSFSLVTSFPQAKNYKDCGYRFFCQEDRIRIEPDPDPQPVLRIRFRDQVLFCSLDPGSGMGKKSGSGSGINNPDHIFRELRNNFLG